MPESAMFTGVVVPSLTTARLPVCEPKAEGVKVALKVTVPPAATVAGRVSPLTEKPLPVTFACEMVTLVPPVLLNVSESVPLLPTWTLPKARLVGDAARTPGDTPVPDSGTTVVPPLVVKVALPL